MMAGDISGVVFDDLNRNGVDDPNEDGLAGWTVFADTNNDGQFNPGEPNTVTDTKGKYLLTGLAPVATTVYDVPRDGYSPSPGFPDHRTITVRDRREVKLDFPNATTPITTGEIVGTVFVDDNENGAKDSGEDGLVGWTLFIDTNADGVLTDGEPSTVTNIEGDYLFADVPAGPAIVYEIPQGGYAPVSAGLFPTLDVPTFHHVTVSAGNSVQSDFANTIPQIGTIRGSVWNDNNGDGIRTLTEAGISGRTVFVDLNSNGLLEIGEPSRITDVNGEYSFTGIHTGSYRVTEIMPDGWINAVGRASAVTANVFRGGTTTVDFFNLVPVSGSISGALWNDQDGNGIRGLDEAPIAGWSVFSDTNANGTLDSGELQASTDSEGNYTLSNVPYGLVTIREQVANGWIAVNPASAASSFLLLNGENRTGWNFGNRENIGTVQGTVWGDANGNRLHDAGETALAGWSLFLDTNANGTQESTEPTAQTDDQGHYTFPRTPVGHYSVINNVPSGWIPAEGAPSTVAANVVIGGVVTANFFDLQPVPGSVSGRIWIDPNSNASIDATEVGVEGWQVYADINKNGAFDASEPQATSDAEGNYSIANIPYGTVTITEILPLGYIATTPTARTSLLLNGENRTGVNFGAREPNDFTISGTAFSDVNHDGIRNEGEGGISGITVYIDTNNNGLLDPTEPTAITSIDQFYTPTVNEKGNYSFTHLARGTYVVREIVPAELDGTTTAARENTVGLGPTSQSNVHFANNYRPNEIRGVVFDDTNNNGTRETSEYTRPGVTVYIDLDRDDIDDIDEPHATTGDDGSYAFTGLTPGAYIVREKSGGVGPLTSPATGGGVLWPSGTSHPSIGNVTPSSITTSLAQGETYSQTVSLSLPGGGSVTNLVDVFLLFDDTGSFTANSPIVRAAFPTIIDTLQASLPGIDLGFGVGRLEEYGGFAFEYNEGRPFVLNQPIVASSTPGSAAAIQSALDRMAPGYGGDEPETDIEALYQLVTGRGFDGNNNGSVLDSGPAGRVATQTNPGLSGDVPSFDSFVADPANGVLPADGNVGGAGFRPGALPIVLLATDTGFAYQPKGETVITGTGGVTLPLDALTDLSRATTPFGSGAGIQETVTALNALGALVVGIGTNPDPSVAPRSSLEAISLLTGAVNRSTTTIANGTSDQIAPGDPMYFQISSGFGTTVADGVVNAIQNGVTNVAMDITVRASDPRVQITNLTGTLVGIGAGQTASFDISFTGDGRPHRFDLQFVREGTNVVLGSIPVVLGTPVIGDHYSYDELEDGEIHHSSHFGHYLGNVAPSFTAGVDHTSAEDSGVQTVAGWATNIAAGPASESAQTVNFMVTTDNPSLFAAPPSISTDGTLTYTAAPNASGSAVVNVVLHDNGGTGPDGIDTSAPQSFVINVTPVNDAPTAANDFYTTAGSTEITVTASGVLDNDSDSDNDILSSSLAVSPLHGTVTLNADGSFVYQPEIGFVGMDSFGYIASDGSLNSNVGTVTVEVTVVNHAPIAGNDTYAIAEDTVLSVLAPGLVANDSDADADSLTVSVLTLPAHGTLLLTSAGAITYTPDPNYVGTDSFTYVATDGLLNSNVAQVTLDVLGVNDAPQATSDSYSVAEDATLTSPLRGVLVNDSDVDGDPLVATLGTGPSHGTLTLNADGSFLYLPSANYSGTDSFTYTTTDGLFTSDLATVTLSITAVNDAPTSAGESYTSTEDTVLNVSLPGLLGNDSDVDGNVLRAVRVTSPAHGTLTLNTNGTFSYLPSANYNGLDSFTYQANDGVLSSNVSTVTISIAAVNDAPTATFDSYSTSRDVVLTVPARGVLTNDVDIDGNAITASLVTAPTHGSLVLNADGSFSYSPASGYVGPDSFTYVASDSVLASAPATVNLTVTPPAAKFFVADADRLASFQYGADGSAIANTVLNRSNGKPRGIASNSTGTTQWVVDGAGSVYVYGTGGTLLGQWQPRNVGKPEGITVWGNDLWIVDPTQDRVFKFTGGANIRSGRVDPTSSFALNSANLNSTDIVADGSHVWVLNDTLAADKVFRYSTTGTLEGSWNLSTTNPSPTGITLDPTHIDHLWVVDASTDRVYQYDGATSRLSGAQEPSSTFALATTNTNPQGIADPMPSPTNQATDAAFATGSSHSGLSAVDHIFGEEGKLTRRHRASSIRRASRLGG